MSIRYFFFLKQKQNHNPKQYTNTFPVWKYNFSILGYFQISRNFGNTSFDGINFALKDEFIFKVTINLNILMIVHRRQAM